MSLKPTPDTLRTAMHRKILAGTAASKIRRARARSRAPRIRYTPRMREHFETRLMRRAFGDHVCRPFGVSLQPLERVAD